MFKSTGDWIRVPDKKQKESDISELSLGCGLCDEGGWCSETEVAIHKITHHSTEINAIFTKNFSTTCQACTNTFLNKERLIRHYKQDHLYSSPDADRIQREIFICHHCDYIFFNKLLLQWHMSYRHMQLPMLQCPICFKLVKRRTMWRHCETHQLHSISICPICLIKCKNKYSLQKHIQTHSKYYNCNICGFETSEENSFKSHIQQYMEEGDGHDCRKLDVKNYCLLRQKNISWRNLICRFGVKGTMLVCNIVVCVLCRHICRDVTQFKKHIYFSHMRGRSQTQEKKVPRHTCYCGEAFSTNVLLKQHVVKLKEPHRCIKDAKPQVVATMDFEEETYEVEILETDSE